MNPHELTAFTIAIAEDKKAQNIIALDFRGRSILFDFAVIMTGTSKVQTKAIARAIDERVKDLKPDKRQIHGKIQGSWILLDYGSVVAHIFTPQERIFYDIEELWKNVPRLDLEELAGAYAFEIKEPSDTADEDR